MHTQTDLIPLLCPEDSRFSDETGRISVGDIHRDTPCRTLSRPGDSLSFRLPESTGQRVLELQELHAKTGPAFAYQVYLNDALVGCRTMEPLSSALCPWYLPLPAGAGTLSIRLVAGTVQFTAAFLHSDLARLTEEYRRPMNVGMCFPRLTYADYAKDLALLQTMKRDTADLTHFYLAPGIEVNFMNKSDAQLEEQFRYVFRLGRDADLPLIFNFNSWWDCTPCGRDGEGGYLNDIPYQQITYNPLTGKKTLSVPNIWRNTPWLTMNHPRLNALRAQRLRQTMACFAKVRARFFARYGAEPQVKIFIDNEPTYWSQFAYCTSPDSGGDFNERCIADAARDSVDLEPKGPALTLPQREWLLKNLSTYMSDLCKVYQESAVKEWGAVLPAGKTPTTQPLAEDIYTHIFPTSGYPFTDDRHMQYEAHITQYARLGIEAAGFVDPRPLSYAVAAGKWGLVNAERCCYQSGDFHHQLYAYGAACDIFFNYYYDQDIADLRRLDHTDGCTVEERVFGRPVMSFCCYTASLKDEAVASVDNMAISPMRERWVLRPEHLGKGSVTFRIGTAGDYAHGGWVELLTMVRPANGAVSLDWGSDPAALRPLADLPERDGDYQHVPFRVPLDCRDLDPASPLYLRLNMEMNYFDDWAQMNSVWDIRTVAAFPGCESSPARPLTLEEHRALSILTSTRQDCRRLLEQFPAADSKKVRALLETGDYSAACRAILAKVSAENTQGYATPEDFDLPAVSPALPDSVVGTFLSYDPEKKLLRFTSHDLDALGCQPHRDAPCPEDVPVSIVPSEIAGDMLDHIFLNPYTPAAIRNARIDPNPTAASLNPGDKITLTLENGVIRRVEAIRGLARGRIVSVTPASLSAPMHNAFLTLETAPGKQYTFELGMATKLNYVYAPALYAALCGESDLALEPGSIFLVSFEAEQYQNRPFRATEITPV